MSGQLLRTLKYTVFPTHSNPKNTIQLDLHNKVYKFWLEIWEDVFTKSQSLGSLDTDDFFRQHYVQVLTSENEVVACNFSTLFNLKSDFYTAHSYFSLFTPEAHNILRENECHTALSMEYVSSHPKWRKSDIGTSLGVVLTGLGINLMLDLGADVILGAPRKDIKINTFCYDFAFETLIPSVQKCNYECELVAGFRTKVKDYPNIFAQTLINNLWNNRTDLRIEKMQEHRSMEPTRRTG